MVTMLTPFVPKPGIQYGKSKIPIHQGHTIEHTEYTSSYVLGVRMRLQGEMERMVLG